MSMVVTRDIRSEPRDRADATRRVAKVEIVHTLEDAQSIWRRFEASGALLTPFQRYEFQSAWHRNVGLQDDAHPCLIVAYDAGDRPLLLLPLATKIEHGLRIARFFGGKHVAFNMPVFQSEFARTATQTDIDAVIEGLRAKPRVPDVLALTRQPAQWAGIANPMRFVSHQSSVNDCPVMTIVPDSPPTDRVSASFRRRLKDKEKKLKKLPGYRSTVAGDLTEINRILDMFFAVKPQRMAEQGLRNVFADQGVEPFIRDACRRNIGTGRAIVLHALVCDDEVIAMFGGVADGERFSMMFNTYTMSPVAKFSPGLILMRDIIDHYAAAGYRSLDLGIGADDYKRLFCKEDQDIFDSYIALTARGSMAAFAMSALGHAKRLVKQTPALMQTANAVRGVFRR